MDGWCLSLYWLSVLASTAAFGNYWCTGKDNQRLMLLGQRWRTSRGFIPLFSSRTSCSRGRGEMLWTLSTSSTRIGAGGSLQSPQPGKVADLVN
ncbi:hypothetical protein PVAP13_9KG004818 [Panicum virgatum]|uniref:Secreted protein n=1 Tax=Panicum virgatum TaxID=38727 RepID=A0A8T0N5T9_PANVG|nr:hypothetical protein PVAP13_9KG004818 [Panicum virgatum]